MTPDERKRGLRAAVRTKLLSEAKKCSATAHLPTIIHGHETGLLWEIIDGLVEETAVLDEFMQDIEAVGAKTVGHEWPDLLVTYNRALSVRPADDVKGE